MLALTAAIVGVLLIAAGFLTLARGRTIAPGVTWTTNAGTPARARAVGMLWVAVGIGFIVVGLRS